MAIVVPKDGLQSNQCFNRICFSLFIFLFMSGIGGRWGGGGGRRKGMIMIYPPCVVPSISGQEEEEGRWRHRRPVSKRLFNDVTTV